MVVIALAAALVAGGISVRGILALGGGDARVSLAFAGASAVALASAGWMAGRRAGDPLPSGSSSPGCAGEENFHRLADAMPQIVWTTGPDGEPDYYNRRWYDFTGLPEARASREAWKEIVHPDDVAPCVRKWEESVRSGSAHEMELRLKDRRTGRFLWHLVRTVPARDSAGRIVRWYGTSTNVDELRSIRLELEDRVAERTLELTATNAALLREVAQRQRTDRGLQLQYATAQLLARSSSLEEAVAGILETVRRAMGWEVGEFWQHDPDWGVMKCVEVCVRPTPRLEEFARQSRLFRLESGVGLPGRVRAAGGPVWIGTLATDDGMPRRRIARTAELDSGVGFPIPSGSDFGVFDFLGAGIPEPDAETLALLTGIAGQVGQFIDRKRSEAALAEATNRLQAVLDAATELAVIATTPDGLITVFNSGAERLLGYSSAEMVGKQTPAVLHCPDEIRSRAATLSLELGVTVRGFETFATPARRGQSTQQEWTYIRKDGTHVPVTLVVTAQRNPAGGVIGFLGIAKDISGRKQAEVALAGAKDAAEAASRAKSDFLAVMSHEIRTPLNGILGMANLILDTELTPTQRDYLASLQLSAENLRGLVDDVLDLSKIEAGKLDLDSEPFDLRGGLADMLRPLSLKAHERGLEVACRIAPAVPDALLGDFGRLRQILVNLIGNAIKFTAKGEVVLDVRLDESAGDEVALRFAVRDTGIGIAPDKLGTIFQPFEQADGSTTRKYGGTGLGLTISARLARLLGGAINVESEPGHGSTFSFSARMPVRQATARSTIACRVRGGRALVIEDNATQRAILLEMLTGWGLTPIAVAGVGEGMEALCGGGPPFQIVLLDSTLPDDGAAGLVRQLRQTPAWDNLPLVVMTAEGADQPTRWSELGVGSTLPKPIRQSQLRQVLRGGSAGRLAPIAPATKRAAECAAGGDPPLRILLAEDNKINQVVMTHTLHKEGHQVVVAENGQGVLDAIAREAFDLVLMDVAMPGMDGQEATRRLRAGERDTGRRLPVVALTANVLEGDREACLAAGMDAYVGKPFHIDDLREAIRGVVGKATPAPTPSVSPPPPPKGPTAPKPSVLDGAKLLARIEGNWALLRSLNGLFRVEGPRQLAAIRTALDAGDADGVERAAHTLKGAVGLLSAPKTAEIAGRLEAMGKARDLAGAEPAYAGLAEAVDELRVALDALEGKRPADD